MRFKSRPQMIILALIQGKGEEEEGEEGEEWVAESIDRRRI